MARVARTLRQRKGQPFANGRPQTAGGLTQRGQDDLMPAHLSGHRHAHMFGYYACRFYLGRRVYTYTQTDAPPSKPAVIPAKRPSCFPAYHDRIRRNAFGEERCPVQKSHLDRCLDALLGKAVCSSGLYERGQHLSQVLSTWVENGGNGWLGPVLNVSCDVTSTLGNADVTFSFSHT
jgi:hypothetical protein